jgi:hypothetical protein
MSTYLDTALLQRFTGEAFAARRPFPWTDFERLLTPGGFAALYAAFPALDVFERHDGLTRADGQRPHNRYYLAYGDSIYHRTGKGHYGLESRSGTISHEALPAAWQEFIEELQGDAYGAFVRRALGVDAPRLCFAWHVGTTGSEVSPHRDARDKVGTHIFYFNTADDWRPEWGGSMLALGGKKAPRMNPDFDDFESETAIDIRDNRSFLFGNAESAWHGVRPLTCPPGAQRRLFNVIVESAAPATTRSSAAGRILRWLR